MRLDLGIGGGCPWNAALLVVKQARRPFERRPRPSVAAHHLGVELRRWPLQRVCILRVVMSV